MKWHVRESYTSIRTCKNQKVEMKPIMQVREQVIEWETADDN